MCAVTPGLKMSFRDGRGHLGLSTFFSIDRFKLEIPDQGAQGGVSSGRNSSLVHIDSLPPPSGELKGATAEDTLSTELRDSDSSMSRGVESSEPGG